MHVVWYLEWTMLNYTKCERFSVVLWNNFRNKFTVKISNKKVNNRVGCHQKGSKYTWKPLKNLGLFGKKSHFTRSYWAKKFCRVTIKYKKDHHTKTIENSKRRRTPCSCPLSLVRKTDGNLKAKLENFEIWATEPIVTVVWFFYVSPF